ncbi:MAG: hypothetical protein JWO41_174 [Candidatus Saccharibacteria bacterium]|nr:hypothetical protein [Candidatus Saccharibacteria bacterium]
MIAKNLLKNSYKPKVIATIALSVGVLLYLVGLRLPLVVMSLLALAIFLPFPSVFSSWASRVTAAVFFLYALIQVASTVQFLTYPGGKFKYIAVLLGAIVIGFIWLFGRFNRYRAFQLFSFKDALVVMACSFLMLCFTPILSGNKATERIATIAGTQITDSVVHFASISGYATAQNLHYHSGTYYPSGFHITTAFIENAAIGEINNISWKSHVAMYAAQYVVLALLLGFTIVYFGFFLLEKCFDARPDKLAYVTVSLVLGMAMTPLYLLLFINEGYTNYFYVCGSLLFATMYVLENDVLFRVRDKYAKNWATYTWPFSAFLLLGFGASFSWTLFALPVLITAGLLFVLSFPRTINRDFVRANLPVAAFAILNLITLYFQTKYSVTTSQSINYGGAITSYNIPLLLVGLAAMSYVVMTNVTGLARRFVIVMAPYVLLAASFLAWQLFTLGEAHYYFIKSSIVLEMLCLITTTVIVTRVLSRSDLPRLLQAFWSFTVMSFLLIGTIALIPQPFQEIRGMFRDTSGVGKPPYFVSDVKLITNLGSDNKITDFNVTILHYDAQGDRLFAHIEPALWANAMTNHYQSTDATLSLNDSRSSSCFSKQFSILAYGIGGQIEQQRLVNAVRDCIVVAASKHIAYYIVTDGASANYLRSVFGDSPKLITE